MSFLLRKARALAGNNSSSYKRLDDDDSQGQESYHLLEAGQNASEHLNAIPISGRHPVEYNISPLQRWITPYAKRAQRTMNFEVEDLPIMSKDSAQLRASLDPLKRYGLVRFLTQGETGGYLLKSAVLELISSLCVLAGPVILRQLLEHPSVATVGLLFAASLLGSLTGRAKDQVCRIQAIHVASVLKSGLFEKSLKLSVDGKVSFPPATTINIFNHDIGFFQNYLLKFHDIWSAVLQILVIAVLATWILGPSSIPAFIVMSLLLVSQSKANMLSRSSVMGYITHNDTRMKHLRDFLYNVKGVKVQSLQNYFFNKIEMSRNSQLENLGTYLKLTFCFFSSMNQMIPAVTATTALVAYWWTGHEALTAEVIFPVLALFDLLYQPAGKLSISVTRQFSVLPSYRRIMSFLQAQEVTRIRPADPLSNKNAVEFSNFTTAYPEKPASEDDSDIAAAPFSLGPLNFSIPKGQLTIVVGPVGSGKSTLLLALAGYLSPKPSSTFRGTDSMALSTQEPWIRSGTVRENIVFTSQWDEVRYKKIVRACCLEPDFASWPAGDRTNVGEKGSTVSGGQRARISLARAVYSGADILLLDDPLAAVDAYVGSRLFHDCIRELEQTVVLVTHQTSYLPQCDYIVALQDGKVIEAGWRSDILQSENSYAKSMIPKGIEDKQAVVNQSNSQSEETMATVDDDEDKEGDALHDEEERATGHVTSEVYKLYFAHAGGKTFITSIVATIILSLAIRVLNQYWFVWWLNDDFGLSSSWYMTGYGLLTIGQALSMAFLGIIAVSGSLRASSTMHRAIVANLLHATSAYFETQPVGRIINRLSNDLDRVDVNLMNAIDGLLNAGGAMTASTIMIIVSAPWTLLVMTPAVFIAYKVQSVYRIAARELRRLISILESPVVTVLSESLNASSLIKAFKAERLYLRLFDNKLDPYISASVVKDSLDTWVTCRAELISATIVLTTGMLYVSGGLSSVQAGLALSTAITFSKNVYLLLWSLIQVEFEMNCVERLGHYIKNIPREDVGSESTRVHASWPVTGAIDLKNVVVQYRNQPTPTLKNVNLDIKPGQRVGLVGRTGSGKTTLVSTLSRLMEISSGCINIDGTDIARIPLQQLRGAVHVLPQEPLLFEASLRENLDPLGQHSDSELWEALRLCGLSDAFRSQNDADGLRTAISFGGDNLSAGQMQLLCMARAVVQRPKILIIDEATASVDAESDKLIQQALQTQFKHTTILCIAHRIATLTWMDQIVVMDEGEIIESGSPRSLLLQDGNAGGKESAFRKLMSTHGDKFLKEAIASATV